MVALQLPVTARAPRLAREALEEIPELAPHEDLRFEAVLLTTELVANAVRHGGLAPDEDLALLIETDDGVIHVEVIDPGRCFYPLEHVGSTPGLQLRHGLRIVDLLADRWGFRRETAGCCVWFELDLVPGRRPWRGRERISLRGRAGRTRSPQPLRP